MENWEDSKKTFIGKLDKADRAFEEIFRKDSEGLLIRGEDFNELKKMQNANKVMLNKLQSREFSVSIVGLEKAGKSSLGNALINSMVLPEYATRCTYTTTEIRSGDEDVAEVYFYSKDKFNKNFKGMLSEIKYPDPVDFELMTLKAFDNYWQAVKNDPERQNLYNTFDTSTVKDIRDMLNGKETVLNLLGQATKKFGKEYWGHNKFNEFQTYITGITGKDSNGATIRKPEIPHTVEKVIIRSKELKDKEMGNFVLYDVPGFNSPTKLHKRQTEEMLKKSDAIILVTNVGTNPDLTGPELDMLRTAMNTQDTYGVNLNEKAFAFGNQIDRVNDEETARVNFATLKNGVISNRIALEQHVVVGSARAYLEDKGLLEGNKASEALNGLQLENGSGIDVLREKMQYYYANDRFNVLKKQAETTLNKTRDMLENLLERYNTGEFTSDDISVEIVQDIQARLPIFDKNAHTITREHIKKVQSDIPFTFNMKSNIETIFKKSEAYSELINDAEYGLNIKSDNVYPASKVDSIIRDKLKNIFTENIVSMAVRLTTEQQKELRDLLVAEFLNVMGMESATPYREALVKSVNELFDFTLIDDNKNFNFNSLVERFSETIIRTLIETLYADNERYETVGENLADLVSLSVYYNMPEDDGELSLDHFANDSKKFFAAIMAHEGYESEIDASENESYLRGIFEGNKEVIYKGLDIASDLIPVGKWAKLIMKAGINLAKIQDDRSIRDSNKIDNKIEDLIYKDSWKQLNKEEREQKLSDLMQSYIAANNSESNVGINAYLEELNEKARNSVSMKSKEDMLSVLDADIEILRDITNRAVIKAIDLERAYISVITKNVQLIRTHLQEGEGAEKFRKWCRANASKLMPSKFESINETKAMNENRTAIVNTVKNVLDNWAM